MPESPGPMSAPSITLRKGGGALRGIGEKFAASSLTGTGSMTVPIAASPARSGFGPQLSLSYDSAAGNDPFGFGWSLSVPSITRKTDKGLPRYLDEDESDVFVLSGVEDLAPVLDDHDRRIRDTTTAPPQSLNHAITIAVRKGRIVAAGLKGLRPVRELPVDDVIYKELTIRSVLSMPVDDTFRAIEIIESRRYPFEKMHTLSLPLEQAEDAIHALAGDVPGVNPIHLEIVPGAPRRAPRVDPHTGVPQKGAGHAVRSLR